MPQEGRDTIFGEWAEDNVSGASWYWSFSVSSSECFVSSVSENSLSYNVQTCVYVCVYLYLYNTQIKSKNIAGLYLTHALLFHVYLLFFFVK